MSFEDPETEQREAAMKVAIEPIAAAMGYASWKELAGISIAISLKRIADVLEGGPIAEFFAPVPPRESR